MFKNKKWIKNLVVAVTLLVVFGIGGEYGTAAGKFNLY